MNYLYIFLCLLVVNAHASNDDFSNDYFSSKQLQLSPQETKGVAIANHWTSGKKTSFPVPGANGEVNFLFGSGQMQVLCAVLEVCDIALQRGESINNISIGDERFKVEPGVTGQVGNQQIHLLLNPTEVGLETSLVVTTERHTYHFRLRSTRHKTMPYITFSYPGELNAKVRALQQEAAARRARDTLPETHEYLGNLNFNYRVRGNPDLKPYRVYNDGVKTIIEMPESMLSREAPVLLLVGSHGFFRKKETAMVNYRLQGRRYIVDNLFDEAILVLGVGRDARKVTITRIA